MPDFLDSEVDDQTLLGQVIDHYHQTLKNTSGALDYLTRRGITNQEIIDHFRVGYVDFSLAERIPSRQARIGRAVRDSLRRLGVLGLWCQHRFRGCVVFPVTNGSQIVDLYGRKVSGGLKFSGTRHHYLSDARRGVWNIEALAGAEEIILCPSLFDALSFWNAGFRNVTCTFGPDALTDDHLLAFHNYSIRRVLLMDEGVAPRLSAAGIECRLLRFRAGVDANQHARKSREPAKALGEIIAQAVTLGADGCPLTPVASESTPVKPRRPAAPKTPRTAPCLTLCVDDQQKLLAQVVDYYHRSLKESTDALDYLHRRGITASEALERFRIGYCNRTFGLRLPVMQSTAGKRVRTQLQRLGIYRGSGHEHFRGCIVFPVTDGGGQIVDIFGWKIGATLRKSVPKEMYLSDQRHGVWNIETFQATKEIILCSSLFDALTFWNAGYRNVTCTVGTLTDDHLTAFREFGTERVLTTTEAIAPTLLAAGLDCFRIRIPSGMSVNEYALQSPDPSKSLGELIRMAEWFGKGQAAVPVEVMAESAERDAAVVKEAPEATEADDEADHDVPDCFGDEPGNDMDDNGNGLGDDVDDANALGDDLRDVADDDAQASSDKLSDDMNGSDDAVDDQLNHPDGKDLDEEYPDEFEDDGAADHRDDLEDEDNQADEDDAGNDEPEQTLPTSSPILSASPLPPAPEDVDADVNGDEVTIQLGHRRYRIRGLSKNLSFSQLKVNILATTERGMFVDTFDLYAARHRRQFIAQAAVELCVEENTVKRDLGRVLLKLEELQEEQIAKATEPKQPMPTMTHEEREAALTLLRDPKLLSRIVADFDVVGETTNKLIGYLAAVSRKLDQPLAIIIQSSSSAGKTSLMDAILAFVPPEDQVKYSAMTGQALYYLGENDLKHKILGIVEEEGAERASYALKLLQSEGALTIASTGKDANTGRMVTQEYRVEGPTALFLTTTAIKIDEELLNRCIVLSVDENREQTRAIHQFQRRRQTLAGLLAEQDRQSTLALHHNAQRLLRPLLVANPYAEALTFQDDKTRTRRDHVKYLTLIRAVTLLHQYQREIKTAVHNDRQVEFIEVSLDDIATANRLACEVLGRLVDELPPQTQKLLGLIDEMVTTACQRLGIDRADYRFSRRDVREFTHWGHTQIKVHLKRLEDMEYLLVHRGGRGQSFVYELLYEPSDTQNKFLTKLIDVGDLKGRCRGRPDYGCELVGAAEADSRAEVGAKSASSRADVGAVEMAQVPTYKGFALAKHQSESKRESGTRKFPPVVLVTEP